MGGGGSGEIDSRELEQLIVRDVASSAYYYFISTLLIIVIRTFGHLTWLQRLNVCFNSSKELDAEAKERERMLFPKTGIRTRNLTGWLNW